MTSPTASHRRLEALHPEIHATDGSIGNPLVGALGPLISPSRGLLIFGPVVLVACAGLGAAWRERELGLRWLVGAAAVQFGLYATYSVRWGGHTYGPRYLPDLRVVLAPAGALGTARILPHRVWRGSGAVLLAWSVGVAGLGAFVCPHDAWNTRPDSVDRYHEQLWEVRDSQIPRAIASPLSPHNYHLLQRATVRRPPE